jgi:hypothetical protein
MAWLPDRVDKLAGGRSCHHRIKGSTTTGALVAHNSKVANNTKALAARGRQDQMSNAISKAKIIGAGGKNNCFKSQRAAITPYLCNNIEYISITLSFLDTKPALRQHFSPWSILRYTCPFARPDPKEKETYEHAL